MHKLIAVAWALLTFNLIFFNYGVPIPGTFGAAAFIASATVFVLLAFAPRLARLFTQPTTASVYNPKTVLFLRSTTAGLTFLSLIRASEIDRFFLTVLALASTSLIGYILIKPEAKVLALSELVLYFPRLALAAFPALFNSLDSVLEQFAGKSKIRHKLTDKVDVVPLIRGGILTVMVVFVLIGLLAAGDAAFESFIDHILNFDVNLDWLDRLIASVIITGIAVPMTYLQLKQPFHSPLANPIYRKYSTELYMLVTSVLAIMCLFMVIQAPYLFARVPETQLHQFGINTYSEYVRRGFIELTMVSAVIYGVTALAYLVIRTRTLVQDWLKWLTISLLTVDSLFILSIFRRLYLYSSSHGLTLARIYGLLFLFAIIGWTVTLIGRLSLPRRFIWHYLEAGIVVLAVCSPVFLNPEQLIVRYAPPTVNEELDYTYLARLPADGVEGWLLAYKEMTEYFAEHPDIFVTTEITDATYRELVYQQQIMYALITDYHRLNHWYGPRCPEDYDAHWGDYCTNFENSWYTTNWAEKAAFTWLKAEVEVDELTHLKDTLVDFLYQVDQTRQTPPPALDRSSQSPLID